MAIRRRARALFALSLLGTFAAACGTRDEKALTVSTDTARACDVLLDVGDAKNADATFGAGVQGAASHNGKRLGVSFVASNGQPFDAHAVTVLGAPAPKLLTSTCYDADGRPLASPRVTLQ
jgi:hypothetical protein